MSARKTEENRITVTLDRKGEPVFILTCEKDVPVAMMSRKGRRFLRQPTYLQKMLSQAVVEWFRTDAKSFDGLGLRRMQKALGKDL